MDKTFIYSLRFDFVGSTRDWRAGGESGELSRRDRSGIKVGQTVPYSGPASAYGMLARTEAAYLRIINESGGVNGRKINLISLDDALRALPL